ncbi:SET and MYND domain-containing protein 4-like [Sitodiplosis mosellana]|uniref:SET and MYND domain-containing protein 4-like n=1 Tax=Sitodiplosis mosellana TaxID=263140 RepID=UPI002443EAEF|nr:SET and MYND domain-containing protein 4-like [Sitodiplosis mosellana]
MDNLWKKETGRADYVNLFSTSKESSVDMFVELLKMQQTRKDNQQSTEWRSKGNEFFRQENWEESLKCYNKSLCFAEVGTENVALAYSNRSACYFHLRLYNQVLIDIELAKNAKLPDRLLPKLEQRKNESELMKQLMPMFKREEKSEPKLSYEADKNIPCMANVVEIKYNEKFGRHLIAKCDIPVGQTVLVENDIPRIRDKTSVCYTCYRLHLNCMACPNCPDVMFCGVDCMNRNETHKLECGTFFPHIQLEGKMVIRTLLLAITRFLDVDKLMQFVEGALLKKPEALPTSLNDPKSKYHFFFKLSTSAPYAEALDDAHHFYKMAMNLPKVSSLFESARKKRFLMHLIAHHAVITKCNAITAESQVYVANVSSLLNHSCAPNIMSHCVSSFVYGETKRPIKKGEQLFFNYSITWASTICR